MHLFNAPCNVFAQDGKLQVLHVGGADGSVPEGKTTLQLVAGNRKGKINVVNIARTLPVGNANVVKGFLHGVGGCVQGISPEHKVLVEIKKPGCFRRGIHGTRLKGNLYVGKRNVVVFQGKKRKSVFQLVFIKSLNRSLFCKAAGTKK